jgi:SAM-dependent methyltransferase
LATQDSTNLPESSADLVLLSDVYHHLEKPEKTLASIHHALRPGGELIVIDFDRVEGRSSEFVLKHVRAAKAVVIEEIERAGFAGASIPEAPRFKENFFLRFRKARRPEILPSRSDVHREGASYAPHRLPIMPARLLAAADAPAAGSRLRRMPGPRRRASQGRFPVARWPAAPTVRATRPANWPEPGDILADGKLAPGLASRQHAAGNCSDFLWRGRPKA